MADLLLRYPPAPAVSRVRIARGSLSRLGAFTRSLTGAPRVVLLSDTRVAALYAAAARRSLGRAGVRAELVRVPAGERSKSPRRLAASIV